MKKRIKRKIIKRFEMIDHQLSQFFLSGNYKNYRLEITYLRGCIQYWRRRYPNLYRKTFGLSLEDMDGELGVDLGHINAGRW